MAALAYLSGTDLEAYGVPTATTAQVQRASALIDAYLKRPEGCVWVPDTVGNPCYMAGLDPTITLKPPQAIAPGAAVQISIPGYNPGDEVLGEVVILDRGNQATVEACVIQAFGAGQVTLQSVSFAHAAGCTMDFGLVVTEEKPMPNQRSLVHLMQWPIARPLSGVGRYGYGRRSDQMLGYFYDVNLLSMFSSFGGPPVWELFEIQASSLNPITGQYWVPAGVLLSYFTDVKVRYVAGWRDRPAAPDEGSDCHADRRHSRGWHGAERAPLQHRQDRHRAVHRHRARQRHARHAAPLSRARPRMTGAQFQASIDRMLGSVGRTFGKPYAVYRITAASSGDFPGGGLRLAQSMAVLRNRVSGRNLEQNQTTERTLWYELVGDLTRFRLGDVFIASDGPYAPGQSYGASATSVPGTSEIDGFAFAWHAPVQPPHGARLDRRVGIDRPELTPGAAADGSTRWNTTHDTDMPLILAAGTLSFGSPGGTASLVPCGFGGVDRPFRGGEFEPDRIGITEAFLAHGYLPPLLGYTPSEVDALITVDDTRYIIVSVYRQETDAVGSQCLLARLISQST